jgi:hypothetical protein
VRLQILFIYRIEQRQMSRDTTYYTDPEDFRPERYLKEQPELDPNTYMFGFGRRYAFPFLSPFGSLLTPS